MIWSDKSSIIKKENYVKVSLVSIKEDSWRRRILAEVRLKVYGKETIVEVAKKMRWPLEREKYVRVNLNCLTGRATLNFFNNS